MASLFCELSIYYIFGIINISEIVEIAFDRGSQATIEDKTALCQAMSNESSLEVYGLICN